MRAICCPTCGEIKPTPPEDAARKLFRRYERGFANYEMSCDLCGTVIGQNDPCVAITCPKDRMPGWEEGYIHERIPMTQVITPNRKEPMRD